MGVVSLFEDVSSCGILRSEEQARPLGLTVSKISLQLLQARLPSKPPSRLLIAGQIAGLPDCWVTTSQITHPADCWVSARNPASLDTLSTLRTRINISVSQARAAYGTNMFS